MDTTLAAGWIAFWGAVGGAVVGGVIAGAASWFTGKSQWKRELLARQRDRLEGAVAELHAELHHLAAELEEGTAPVSRINTVAALTGVVSSKAAKIFPHLSKVTAEGMSEMVQSIVRPRAPRDMFARRDVANEVLVRLSAEWAAPRAAALAVLLGSWMRDAEAFERDKRALDDVEASITAG